MGNPIVHFEIRAEDPDAARAFYGELFGWEYPEGGIPGYTYVESGVPGAIPGGIGPTQGGASLVTFFVGVEDVEATLKTAERLGGRSCSRPLRCPASRSGCSPTRRATSSESRRCRQLRAAPGRTPQPTTPARLPFDASPEEDRCSTC